MQKHADFCSLFLPFSLSCQTFCSYLHKSELTWLLLSTDKQFCTTNRVGQQNRLRDRNHKPLHKTTVHLKDYDLKHVGYRFLFFIFNFLSHFRSLPFKSKFRQRRRHESLHKPHVPKTHTQSYQFIKICGYKIIWWTSTPVDNRFVLTVTATLTIPVGYMQIIIFHCVAKLWIMKDGVEKRLKYNFFT